MKELCDWLICCRHLWPEAASNRCALSAAPFDLHRRNQTLQPDPACVETTLRNILGASDDELMQNINDYVDIQTWPHWLALWKERHPATRIDARDEPAYWPEECLKWAVLTMNMNGADLSYAKLDGLNMSGLGLRGAILFGCDFRGLIARGCDLEYADFSHALMEEADMTGSKVAYALFRRTRFPGANLAGLTFSTDEDNLEGADMEGAGFSGAALDRGPYNIGKNGAYAMSRNLPPQMDLRIREKLNYLIKREHGSLAIKYLHRFLIHIKMSPEFCKECLALTPAEDRAVLLQKLMCHAVDRHYEGTLQDIAGIYKVIEDAVDDQFIGYIDKESLDSLRKILDDICGKNLAYLESAFQDDPWREFRMDSTKACLQLALAETRECLKDLTQVLIRERKTSAKGIDSLWQSLKHLNDSNPTLAFRTLIHDLTPKQLHQWIQQDLDIAAHLPLLSIAAKPAPNAGATGGKISAVASIRQGNRRQLIDLLHDQLPPEIHQKIHTLLQDDTDEPDKPKKSIRVQEGDCDYLDSYTANAIGVRNEGIGGAAAYLHADQMASDDAPAEPAPAWKSAIFAYMLLPPSHFLEQYAAGFSFSTAVAANDDSNPP